MQGSNGYWRMHRRCETLTPADFVFTPDAAEEPAQGELTIRTRYIALDPYLSRAMRSWAGEVPEWTGGIIHGRVVGEVIASCAEGFAVGDHVLAVGRWQKEQVVPAARTKLISHDIDPPRLALGVLGASGMTAWVGLHLARPVAGGTLLVSAATGPVGSVVGQLAKARGLRVIGTAGGADKCAYAHDTLGFDVCLDHRQPELPDRIANAAPDGIDILFENVGGPNLDAALPAMSHGGRIMLCGLAAHYNDDRPLTLTHFKTLLYRAITLRGFITAEHPHLYEAALRELTKRVTSGEMIHREVIAEGLENAPIAYLEMLRGAGIGKRLVRV